jgi:hypothetical protein
MHFYVDMLDRHTVLLGEHANARPESPLRLALRIVESMDLDHVYP